MLALVADGQVDRIVVKSHERVPSEHMSVLSDLCNRRKTEIVVVRQYGKSLVDMADIELRRKKALRATNRNLEDAVKDMKKSWKDEKIVMLHHDLRRFYTLANGYKMQGNTNRKKFKPQKS